MGHLERRLFTSTRLDLAEGALIASGVRSERELESYLSQLDRLCPEIARHIPKGDERRTAEALFDWLWESKPERYRQQGNFRLTQVIEAQLSEEEQQVGNCLGLTTLHNVLAQRFKLRVKAIYLDNAFGRGPHVFSILYTEDSIIDIENILPDGFDFQGHLNNQNRREWDDREIIADIYMSAGNELFGQKRWEEAISHYDRAIRLNPDYSQAYFNKGMALSELGRLEEAAQTFEKATHGYRD